MGQEQIYDFVDDPTYSHYPDESNVCWDFLHPNWKQTL